jgi:hypothetical protein
MSMLRSPKGFVGVVDVLTCQEDGITTWADDRLLERATQLGRVLFSQDDDLLAIAHQWQRTTRPLPGWTMATSWICRSAKRSGTPN